MATDLQQIPPTARLPRVSPRLMLRGPGLDRSIVDPQEPPEDAVMRLSNGDWCDREAAMAPGMVKGPCMT